MLSSGRSFENFVCFILGLYVFGRNFTTGDRRRKTHKAYKHPRPCGELLFHHARQKDTNGFTNRFLGNAMISLREIFSLFPNVFYFSQSTYRINPIAERRETSVVVQDAMLSRGVVGRSEG